jgi:hypothetical protein
MRMKLRFEPRILGLLQGSIDLHIHSAPDIYTRILNDLELARHAQEMGMRAIVVKNHFDSTAGRARLVTDETGFPVFGAIALNHTVGGLNPHAVEFALKMGAKVVWLPTLHAAKFLENRDHVKNLSRALGEGLTGISLLDQHGSLREEVYPILDLLARWDAILATGHISIEEARAVVRAAADRGVHKIVITHPLASFVNYSVDQMKEMLNLGATWLEHVYNDATRQVGHPIPVKALYDGIRSIGADHCIMSTDSGQWLNPVPVQQFGIYMQDMLNLGLSEQEIRVMTADNPARALGL